MMTKQVMQDALSHALAHGKREVCGVVIVEKGSQIYVPCGNLAEVDYHFILDPDDYAAADDRGEVIRIVHSHPFLPPLPSQADRVSCEVSGLPWSIVSVPNGHWHHFEPSGYRASLIGREYSHGVLDCYSLVRDYYRESLGIQIPDFNRDVEWWVKGQNLYLENFESAGFRALAEGDALRVHDVLLMQIHSPVPNHAAVYLGDDQILHHLNKRLSSRDIFGGYYRKHCVRIVRHRDL